MLYRYHPHNDLEMCQIIGHVAKFGYDPMR